MASQTVTNSPPAYLLPYLQYGLGQTQQQYENGGTPVVPFSPYSEQAITGVAQRAQAGSPVVNAADDYVMKSLQGGFLGSNPYLDQVFNRAALQTQNQLASQFAGAGRNVDASMGDRSQQLNDLATQIYGGAYNTDRQLQQAALGSAIPLANQDYVDYAQLRGAGSDVEGLAREYAAQPALSLDQYLARIGQTSSPNYGTQSTPLYRNSGAQNVGNALLLGSSIFGGWLGNGGNFANVASGSYANGALNDAGFGSNWITPEIGYGG